MPGYEQAPTETKTEHERRLIVLAQQGDSKAVDWLFGQAFDERGLQDYVFSFCHKQLQGRPNQEIEDVAAEAVFEILKSLPKFDFRSHIKTWAGRILLKRISRYWARDKRDQTVFAAPVGDDNDDEIVPSTNEAASFPNRDALNEIVADKAGKLTKLSVEAGQSVGSGDVIAVIE